MCVCVCVSVYVCVCVCMCVCVWRDDERVARGETNLEKRVAPTLGLAREPALEEAAPPRGWIAKRERKRNNERRETRDER